MEQCLRLLLILGSVVHRNRARGGRGLGRVWGWWPQCLQNCLFSAEPAHSGQQCPKLPTAASLFADCCHPQRWLQATLFPHLQSDPEVARLSVWVSHHRLLPCDCVSFMLTLSLWSAENVLLYTSDGNEIKPGEQGYVAWGPSWAVFQRSRDWSDRPAFGEAASQRDWLMSPESPSSQRRRSWPSIQAAFWRWGAQCVGTEREGRSWGAAGRPL